MRQTTILMPTSVSLFRQVFAGCYEPLLEDGHSRRYPCDFVWALESLPRHDPTVLFVRFFPLDIGLPLGSRGSARGKFPQRSFMWGNISRLQPFVYLQAPILVWPTDCSDLQGPCPFGHRAVYTGQYSYRYRSRTPVSLRVRTGQLTRQDL